MGQPSTFNSQLEVLTNKPPIKGTQVQGTSDLLLLNPILNYTHKLVWVIDEKTFYYLDNGTGTSLSNWKKYQQSSTLVYPYDPLLPYVKYSAVFTGGIIYIATDDVIAGESPQLVPGKWAPFGSSSAEATYKVTFTNTNSVAITSPKEYPHVSVFVGGKQVFADVTQTTSTDIEIKFNQTVSGYVLL
jgi:hypothetical protein